MAKQVDHKPLPKGKRLGWASLKEVKPVPLTVELIEDKRVVRTSVDEQMVGSPIYLIP
jgi:hypothetical protein